MTPARHRQCGDSALLVEFDDLAQVLAVDRALRADRPGWVQDIIPAARTVLVRFDAQSATRQQVSSWIEAAHQIEAPAAAPPPTVRVPVRYDGADLAAVAQLARLSVDQVVAQHSAVEYTAAFCGFAPGFAYLTGVPTALRVPRRATPRTTVPAGAVALADEFTAVYPRASPGGWQLIGSTDLPMFDVDREPPALLSPGTRVLFLPTR